MTGIPAPSLRNWEKRYGFPRPERTPGGHRFYGADDIEFLKRAARLVDEGHNLPQIASLYSRYCGPQEPVQELRSVSHEIRDDVTYRMELIYEALLKFDPSATQQHYYILNGKLSPEQLFDRVFEVILRRLKQDLGGGKITLAQERFASNFICTKLASFLAIEFPATQLYPIVGATLSEEKHEGGLMLVSAHLKFRGYPVYCFGANLPAADLHGVCAKLEPACVLLSYSSIDRLVGDLGELARLKRPVIIGGLAMSKKSLVSFLREEVPAHIFFCEKTVGSEAAHFVELICQSK